MQSIMEAKEEVEVEVEVEAVVEFQIATGCTRQGH